MSRVAHYTVGFGDKTVKFVHSKVPIFLVTVYVAPSNKEKTIIIIEVGCPSFI